MEKAIAIGRYLLEHARAAFALMGTDAKVENAKHLLRVITKRGAMEFSHRDLHEAVRGDQRFKESSSLDEPLAMLVERNYLRPLIAAPRAEGKGGRNKAKRYEVNPQYPQNPQNGGSRVG